MQATLSDYLAAERTLLAWIRTGLAMMGFGFVVARFGLFLQQLEVVRVGGRVGKGHLVRTERTFNLQSVDHFRPSPALG